MKITFLLIHTACTFLLTLQAYPGAPTDYELVKRNENISLYERWIPGKDGEKVRELKTVLTVQSNVQAIIDLLTDGSRGTAWNTNAVAYKVHPGEDRKGWIIYIQYGMPWPFNNQDCCLLYHLNQKTDAKTVLIFNSIVDSRFPLAAKTDRLSGVRGEWILENLNDEKTKVTYTITTDKSKNIPRWVSDPVVRNNLFSTMVSFKTLAEGGH